MKVLYAARVARWDLLRVINMLARLVTKWSKECDKALHRLMCYIHSSIDMTLINYVGKDDTLEDLWLDWFADADLAGERPQFKSTAGYICFVSGPNTSFAYAAKSKAIGSVCSSTPEAELVAANRVIKEIGLATADLFSAIMTKPIQCVLREDNTAAIQIITTGRNPTMRHLARHQGIGIRFLHEIFNPVDENGEPVKQDQYSMVYTESAKQRADILTKAIREATKWTYSQKMINIVRTQRNEKDVPIFSKGCFSTPQPLTRRIPRWQHAVVLASGP